MRWFVEISPLGKSEAEPNRQCVEASQWQEAIKGVRRADGLDDALRNFSIEVLDEGVRAVDPMSRLRYVIRRAPDGTPLTNQPQEDASQPAPAPSAPAPSAPAPAPSAPAPSAPAPKSASAPQPAGKKLHAQTMVYGSPGSAALSQAVAEAQAKASAPPAEKAPALSAPQRPVYSSLGPKPVSSAPAPKPVASAPAPKPVSSAPPAASSPAQYDIVAKREEEPSKASPLTYREYAYAIREGSTEDEAEKFIVERFKEIREALSTTRTAKLVNLAVFDHTFAGKPKRPPLITLVWKDWKGDPEVRYTSRPGVSIPPPSLGPGSSFPPRVLEESQPASKQPSIPTVDIERRSQRGTSQPASKQPSIPTPPSTPAALRQKGGHLGPPQATMRSAESPVDPNTLGARAQVQVPQPAPSQPAQVQPSQPPPAQPSQPAPAQQAQVQPSQPPPAQPSQPAPAQQAPAQVQPSQPPPAQQITPAAKQGTGDEMIADIFESMHDLYFLRDAYEGADFVIALALDKMRCTLGMAQLYDINRREFVVAHGVGPGADKALGNRTTEYDPLLVEIMNRRTPFVVEGKDPRIREGRWANLGGEPDTILACAVSQGGRFLGILEIAHAKGEGNFRKADIHALAYIAQSFAEFVVKTGLLFGSENNLMR